jgi:hypothetical protein
VTIKKTPDRARRKYGPMLRSKHLGQFNKRDVHLLLDRTENNVAMGFNPPLPHVAALRLRPRRSSLPPQSPANVNPLR